MILIRFVTKSYSATFSSHIVTSWCFPSFLRNKQKWVMIKQQQGEEFFFPNKVSNDIGEKLFQGLGNLCFLAFNCVECHHE